MDEVDNNSGFIALGVVVGPKDKPGALGKAVSCPFPRVRGLLVLGLCIYICVCVCPVVLS